MKLKNKLPLIVIALLPIVYLAYIWNELPDQVPMHWNLNGEIDRYGSKMELIMIPLLPILMYGFFCLIPFLDSKNKLSKMGNKLFIIRFLLVTFMTVFALYLIYSIKNTSFINNSLFFLFIGALYLILGNYMKTIRINSFLGIKTPWTLKNETVWKRSHQMGGWLFFISGIIIILSSFYLDQTLNIILILIITGVILITTIVYSYIIFKKISKTQS